MTTEESATDEGVIVGKLSINSISARFFDFGALHSFIHEGFVQDHRLPTREINNIF